MLHRADTNLGVTKRGTALGIYHVLGRCGNALPFYPKDAPEVGGSRPQTHRGGGACVNACSAHREGIGQGMLGKSISCHSISLLARRFFVLDCAGALRCWAARRWRRTRAFWSNENAPDSPTRSPLRPHLR